MSSPAAELEPVWSPERRPWGRGDLVALAAWTAALAGFFWGLVTLQRALFYFDITEINLPYRAFFASELKAGRFSRWCPGLYCGLPLFSESQAGYLHPWKYLLYPWLEPWQAFTYDTLLSIWLTGAGTYGWLRRHVGPEGALTGAGLFGLSGFVWGHFIHTSMINALASVPLVFWAIEWAWDEGRLRGVVLGALALACQVFAGHLQDVVLTSGALATYGLARGLVERRGRPRRVVWGTTLGTIALGLGLAAVQWVPSKELLDRSPRAGGLTWDDLTYGSWHPELLPTMVVREAYGTRARDTDWMDGYYPYHEMNAYLGIIGMALAVVGAAAYRDRWVGCWLVVAGVGGVLMLGRFTFLFDQAHRVPILGSSRIPVRFHLWVALGVAALAGVGVDRLARPGPVRLRGAVAVIMAMVFVSLPILWYIYEPVWLEPDRWTKPYHLSRYRWLGNELTGACLRTLALGLAAWAVATWAARSGQPGPRRRLAALFPVLVIADLLAAHARDVATVAPSYWTQPPATVARLKGDPTFVRLFGLEDRSSGEPGYASEPIDFVHVRDTLAWSLPVAWGLRTAIGATPIIPRRMLRYTDRALVGGGRYDVESVTHLLFNTGRAQGWSPPEKIGAAYLYRNPNALPRVRLMGQPVYVAGEREAGRALSRLRGTVRDHLIVEDPDRPLPVGATAEGTASITRDLPEHVVVETRSTMAAYLVLADTFDPGWSATVDGRPAPIRPAQVAFRAVYLPPGPHTVVFRYQPAGFATGLTVTLVSLAAALVLLVGPWRLPAPGAAHGISGWPRAWPLGGLAAIVVILAVSAIQVGPGGRISTQPRWAGSFHRFTWGAGIDAIRPARRPLD